MPYAWTTNANRCASVSETARYSHLSMSLPQTGHGRLRLKESTHPWPTHLPCTSRGGSVAQRITAYLRQERFSNGTRKSNGLNPPPVLPFVCPKEILHASGKTLIPLVIICPLSNGIKCKIHTIGHVVVQSKEARLLCAPDSRFMAQFFHLRHLCFPSLRHRWIGNSLSGIGRALWLVHRQTT